MPENHYKYAGFRLTPAVFAEVARELRAGSTVRRSELVEAVVNHHLASGGMPLTTNAVVVAKKALAVMELKGWASATVSHGMWSIADGPSHPNDTEPSDEPQPETSEFVYAYYLPIYRHSAEEGGECDWPHKIGMTRTTVEQRLSAQVGTALPEHPVIAISVQTESAALLERALHSVLELRGKRIRSAPGNEWYCTSTEEIESVLRMCGITRWRTEVGETTV